MKPALTHAQLQTRIALGIVPFAMVIAFLIAWPLAFWWGTSVFGEPRDEFVGWFLLLATLQACAGRALLVINGMFVRLDEEEAIAAGKNRMQENKRSLGEVS